MTIDEAIAKYKEITNTDANCPAHCNISCDKCVQESEQIADWLEELVMLRLDSCMIHMPERLHLVENGYNKAIDDFEEKLNAKCDRMIKEKLKSNVAPISLSEAYEDFKDDIYEIAEQLRGRE